MKVIKLHAILISAKTPSARIRFLDLIPKLTAKGIVCTHSYYSVKPKDILSLLLVCIKSDVVLIQKKLFSPFILRLIRLLAKKLIFDFDDAVYVSHVDHDTIKINTRHKKFVTSAKLSNLVIAGNSNLATYATPFANRIAIIPSAIDTKRIVKKVPTTDKSDTISIGWVGTAGNLKYLSMLEPVFTRLAQQYPIEIRVICDKTISIPNVDVRFVEWQLATEAAEIAKLDIGVMPLEDNIFSAGKCAYKAIQYMAAGVPAVVSAVGMNKVVVSNKKDGFVCDSIAEFEPALEALIIDKELRIEMGERAYHKVMQTYTIDIIAEKLYSVIVSL